MNNEFEIISQSRAPSTIVLAEYNRHTHEYITVGPGYFTVSVASNLWGCVTKVITLKHKSNIIIFDFVHSETADSILKKDRISPHSNMKIYLGGKNVLLDLNKEFRFYAMLGLILCVSSLVQWSTSAVILLASLLFQMCNYMFTFASHMFH